MRSRSPFVLAVGFGILIVLIAILGIGAIHRAGSIYRDMQTAQDSYIETEAFRRGIVTDMYLADILVRDYLLDPSRENASRHRDQLLAIRDSLQQRLDELSRRISESNSPRLQRLQTEVQGYWESMDPIFDWSPQEKAEQSWTFLRRKVLPRREAVVTLAREIAKTNDENLQRERQRLRNSQQVLQRFLLQMVASTVGIGIVVALLTSFRVAALEKKHEKQREEIEETQKNLRNLSRQLVQAQEAERRTLSRELHDEVGQMMTALGIELGNLELLRCATHAATRGGLWDANSSRTTQPFRGLGGSLSTMNRAAIASSTGRGLKVPADVNTLFTFARAGAVGSAGRFPMRRETTRCLNHET